MVGGLSVAQADRCRPLQMLVLTAERVSSFWFTTYTVCSGASTTSQNATSKKSDGSTVTVPGLSVAQPARSVALQWRRSNADMVLSKLAVYKVSSDGSTTPTSGPTGSPSSRPILRHPDCAAALQVFALNTAHPFCALCVPIVVTYTVWLALATSTSRGTAPRCTVGGVWPAQPARSEPSQVSVLIIDMVVLGPIRPGLVTYTVWFASSATIPNGPEPTWTWAGARRHPQVTWLLQVAPLNTATVLLPRIVTYTVSVAWSTATPAGRFPTLTVGHGP